MWHGLMDRLLGALSTVSFIMKVWGRQERGKKAIATQEKGHDKKPKQATGTSYSAT
jgi:hypothetical protein